jgi:chaperonin GroEL
MIEKKHRVEDSLAAVASAREEGIVPGGGVALVRAATALSKLKVDNDDQQSGVTVIASAITEPVKQMAKNAGFSQDLMAS